MRIVYADAAADEWQQRMLMAGTLSQQGRNSLSSPSFGRLYDHYEELYENASNRCHDDIYYQCPGDQPVFMIALRWAKILVLKVGHTYYGALFCLMMLPLLIGLLVGYMIGRRTKSCNKPEADAPRHCFASLSFLCNLWDYFSSVYIPPHMKLSDDFKQRHFWFLLKEHILVDKDQQVRQELTSAAEANRESGVDLHLIPKHVAVIMDGNRRYGKKHHPDNPTQGHWDGSRTLVNFCKWCIAEQVQILTVYAFSTENWNRSPDEVAALMAIFSKYCDELRVEAIQRNIRIQVLSTETDRVRSVLQISRFAFNNLLRLTHRPTDPCPGHGWYEPYGGRNCTL